MNFGELRSRIHNGDRIYWEELVALSWEYGYVEMWIPYFQSFPEYWKGFVLRSVKSMFDLEICVDTAPFAYFEMIFQNKKGEQKCPVLRSSFEKVISLQVYDPFIKVPLIDTLVSSPHVKNLEILNIGGSYLRPEHYIKLFQSPYLKQVTDLNMFSGGGINDQVVEALVKPHVFPELEILNLEGNYIGDAGAKAIAKASHMRGMKMLNLRDNRIGREGREALLCSPYLLDCKILMDAR